MTLAPLPFGTQAVTDRVVESIGRMSQLVYLDLADCPYFGPAGVMHLTGLTRLEHLNVSLWGEYPGDMQRRGEGLFQYISRIASLRRLDTSG